MYLQQLFPLLKTSVIYVNPCCAVAKDVESASTFHFLLLKNCQITQYKRKVLVPMLSSIGSHHHSLLFSSSKLWIFLDMSTTSLWVIRAAENCLTARITRGRAWCRKDRSKSKQPARTGVHLLDFADTGVRSKFDGRILCQDGRLSTIVLFLLFIPLIRTMTCT